MRKRFGPVPTCEQFSTQGSLIFSRVLENLLTMSDGDRAESGLVRRVLLPLSGPEDQRWARIYPAGDQGFFIRLGNAISLAIHRRIVSCMKALDGTRPDWIVDCIPTYCTILVL